MADKQLRVRPFEEFLREIGSVRRNVPPPCEDTVTFARMASADLNDRWNELLVKDGWSIVVVDKCSDYYGGKTPPESFDYEKIGGLCIYEHNILLVSSQHNTNLFGAPDKSAVFHTVQHECAHALDRVIGCDGKTLFSSTSKFADAFARDRRGVSDEQWKEFWWLHDQHEGTVHREFLANLIAINSTRTIDSPMLEVMFPATTALLKNRLAEFGIVLPPDRRYEAYGSILEIGKRFCLSAVQKIKIEVE